MKASMILVISAGMTLAAEDGLRQAYDRVVYGMENAGPGRYQGVNPAQRLDLEFSAAGARLKHPQGEAALRLVGYGYGDRLRTPVAAKPTVSKNRVEYRRGELTEWYVNDSRGLEQGFTLTRRPGIGRPLAIALSVAGDLRPELSAEGDAVLLRSSSGLVLRYAGLRAWDARGRAMPSRLQVQGREVQLVVEDEGAKYPLTVDPTWTQQAELIAADGAMEDRFGASLALSGTTAVIGAPYKKIGPNNGAGAVYVFVRSGGTWTLQQELSAADGALNDFFGTSVAVAGDTLVIGAPYKKITQFFTPVPGAGAVYVFVRNGATWTLQQELNAFDAAQDDHFGSSVALSADTAVIGASGRQSYSGAAYVFVRSGATWTQQAEFALSNSAALDAFGSSVAVSGDTAVVGACGRSQSKGAAYAFVRSGATWSSPQELTATDGAANDNFGCPLSLDGDTLAVAAANKTIGSKANQGAVYIFTRSGGVWSQQQELTALDGAMNDEFGGSVSVSGNTAVVGDGNKKVGSNNQQGVVYVFGRSGVSWSQQTELTTSVAAANDAFGASVALSGNTIAVGAVFKTIGSNTSQGAAYVFTLPTTPATHVFNDFAGNGRSGALLYDPLIGQAYTALSNGNGTYQYIPHLFTSRFDALRTGDYNGDGKADLILYNSQTALAYIGFGDGAGTFSFQSLFWSPAYNFVETGDIDGNGETDVALYNSATGTLYTGISNGTGTFTYQYHLVSQGFTFVRLADFTGDGKADLFLYRASDGLSFLGVGDGAGNFTFHSLSVSPGYMVDVGDLNGDGKADVILYNPVNGNAATGISDGGGGFAFTPHLFTPGFTSVRLADHTGDGLADVTLYNGNNGLAYFGTGTGTGAFNFQSLFWSPGYDYVLPQDVNADGKVDVLLYNSATGTEYTGIGNGNGTFTYTYSYWGIGKTLAR